MMLYITRRILITGAALFAAASLLYLYRSESAIRHVAQEPASAVRELAATASADAVSFSFLDQPRSLPDIRFVDGEGRSLSLQEFRKRPVLLNIWATWCVPCRQEMPALDRLQADVGASELFVLALSIDRQGMPVVKKFYQELGVVSLGAYIDQAGEVSSELNTIGVPTTLLIDREGREIGRKVGAAEWDSPEIVALIRARLGLPMSERKVGP